jgi:ABC-type branched-subunit amino acid transport system substrate-binding protein
MKRILRNVAAVLVALAWPALAPAADDGVTPTSVLIGQSAAFTGPAAQLGVQMRDGAKLWFDYVNAQGGIHGRSIVLKTRDDKYEATLAAENTRRFINEDRVFALFAYVGTPTSQASLPIFTEARVPFVAPFTGAELLRQPFNRFVFNVRASYFDETETIVDHLYRTGARKIAVFHQADSYGQAGLEGTTRALTRRNLQVHATGTVQRNSTDVAEAVKSLNGSQPDAVVMISAYGSTAEFVRQMKKAGSVSSFYTVSFVGSKALADALGDEGHGVTISQVVPFPWSPLTPVVKDFLELARRSQVDVNFSTLEGFIAAKVMTEGLRRAGKDLTRDRFIAAMESINSLDLGGFGVTFSSTSHSASKFVDLAMIGRSGKFVR